MVSSGLLALSLLSGITPSDTDGSLTFFSLRLNSPENIPVIFLIITIYLVWQLWSAWLVQADSVRRSQINRIDVFLSFLISISAIGIWCWPYFLRAIGIVSQGDWSFIFTVAGVIAAGLASYSLLYVSTRAREQMLIRKVVAQIASKTRKGASSITIDDLVGKEWLLIFNPINRRSKRITFLSDGEIGSGRNQNESYWRLVNGRLEILNQQRNVFSRFEFNESLGGFEHTNESDTLSIKGQTILPAPA